MGVVISIQRKKAFLREGQWRSSDTGLEQQLNQDTEDWILATGGPAVDSPDPEIEVAREMIRRHGGRIMLRAAAPASQTLRDYLYKRQYKLAFS
jgi:hypothetical protein